VLEYEDENSRKPRESSKGERRTGDSEKVDLVRLSDLLPAWMVAASNESE